VSCILLPDPTVRLIRLGCDSSQIQPLTWALTYSPVEPASSSQGPVAMPFSSVCVLNGCLGSPSSWSPITWWFCVSWRSFFHFRCVTDDGACSALRAMTAEFVFFIGIASICFSGLLFTLWQLASDRWSIKSIAWLMVQIWFGNTTLSFGQASSFHPCKL